MIHVTVATILLSLAASSSPSSTISNSASENRVAFGAAIPEPLQAIDLALNVAGFLIAAIVIWEWSRAGCRDPLRRGSIRSNHLHETDVLMVVVVYMVSVLALSMLLSPSASGPSDVRTTMIVGNGAHVVGILACFIVASKRFTGGVDEFMFGAHERGSRLSIPRLIAIGVLALTVTPLIADGTVLFIRFFRPDFEPPTHPTLSALHEIHSPLLSAGLWCGAMIVAPIAEECFFRGLLQTTMVDLFRSRWAAIVLASAAFGAVHIGQPHVVPALIFLGVLLGYAYERTGGLLAPILIHAMFNLKNLIWDHYAGG